MVGQRRWWCPSCGCVREFWGKPLVDCRHNVPDSAHAPREFVPLPAWHPLAGALS
jgi:hypothetical protein